MGDWEFLIFCKRKVDFEKEVNTLLGIFCAFLRKFEHNKKVDIAFLFGIGSHRFKMLRETTLVC